MLSQRELRYYVNIPKLLLLLFICVLFVVGGQQMLRGGGNVIAAWLAIGFFGLGVLTFLAALSFAVLLRRPLLAVNATGITAAQLLVPWKKVFVPWSAIARIGIRTRRGAHSTSFSTFQAHVRDPNRYSSPRVQRFIDSYDPTLQGIVISVPLGFLFLWASRKRRATFLQHIYQTFAPEIIQYGVVVDEAEHVV